jgi:hypothetical protein
MRSSQRVPLVDGTTHLVSLASGELVTSFVPTARARFGHGVKVRACQDGTMFAAAFSRGDVGVW